jgi:hypothetical protein
MPETTNLSVQNTNASPDYVGLAKYLLQPFLDEPNSLLVDCEQLSSNQKIWLRVSFEGTDRGKVFGRGGRNIHAIRTVLETAAMAKGQTLYLDIYGSNDDSKSHRDSDRAIEASSYSKHNYSNKQEQRKHRPRRSNNGRPSSKPRSESF